MSDDLARIWSGYSRKVYGGYSPLNSALAAAVAGEPELLALLGSLPSHAHDPNMLLAAVQYLVLGGASGPVADLYSTGEAPPPPEELRPLLLRFCRDHEAALRSILSRRRIQTNETGRCGGIALALTCAAGRIGAPFHLVDAGASAGLNLWFDEYVLDFGRDAAIGPAWSPVRLRCEVRPPDLRLPERLPPVSQRMGIDREPVDLSIEENRRWLLACIWPGTGRQDRARAAMDLVAARPSPVQRGDMTTDLRQAVEGLGHGPVAVVTSWSYSYLRPEERKAFEDQLRKTAVDRPVAWVCCDSPGCSDLFAAGDPLAGDGMVPSVLGLAVFDGDGVESSALAWMHSHGAWIEWLDARRSPAPSW